MGLFASLAAFCLAVIAALGYSGVFLLMVAESMVFPVPSEAVVPFAGFLASTGEMSFWLAFLAATTGTLVGSLLSYAMGYYGVRELLERHGKYVLVTPHHVEVAHKFFERRSAAWGIFLSRFVPVVRHLISIPAGGARMPLVPFMLATIAGGGLWNLFLLYVGFKLGENWESIEPALEQGKWIVFAIAVAAALGVVAWWWMKKRRAGASPPAAP